MDKLQEQELRELIDSWVLPGFFLIGDIEAAVQDWCDDVGADSDAALGILQERWKQRLAEQTTWADTGDYGKLSAAFAELTAAGILSRMNFTCCATCATTDIYEERTPKPDDSDSYGYREWAYVYFHQQDADRLAEPNAQLYLGFGAFRPHQQLTEYDTDTLVGQQIVDVLRRHGLEVTWSGDCGERILVEVGQWRKPLP